MILFTWIGVTATLMLISVAVILGGAWVMGYCRDLSYQAQRQYRRSKLCKKFADKAGYDCARYLVRYNEHHGMNRWKFTAREWEEYFYKRLKETDNAD